MSWGERSCQYLYADSRPCKPSMLFCNVSCKDYTWDGKTQPDSVPNHGIDNMLDAIVTEPFTDKTIKCMLRKIKKGAQ